MTEHRKIPEPSKSLFERAENFFGLGGDFRPAPVPKELKKPVNRRIEKKRPPAAPQTGEQVVQDRPAEQSAPVTQVPTPAPVAEPVPEPVYEDVTFSEEVHTIDREALVAHGLIQPEGPVTALLEEFRIVKRQVLQSVRDARAKGSTKRAQRVLVCSPLPNEGKSYCAANLAIALAAEKDSEVLLVDADFGKPSVLSMFGLPRGPGFMDVLARDDMKVEDCVLATDIEGFMILPAGNHTTSDSEFLSSERTAEVLDRLTRAAPKRIIIFDSPPALAASPAAELANHVGQAIVVARADRTGQTSLEDALTLLSACPDLKLLLNAAHFSPSGRRFGDYYGKETF
ncbi:AAA family ATPase [Aurantiacibacter sp. MUD61]|uniref:AAA family ATPase n=1 Tax=Aurantiacibacter sp. MUD61 TaxID=3009083 RepID=UPI0022F10A0B|nr:AAA family ATPase [Aurantiacibacter sp. MUD61]